MVWIQPLIPWSPYVSLTVGTRYEDLFIGPDRSFLTARRQIFQSKLDALLSMNGSQLNFAGWSVTTGVSWSIPDCVETSPGGPVGYLVDVRRVDGFLDSAKELRNSCGDDSLIFFRLSFARTTIIVSMIYGKA